MLVKDVTKPQTKKICDYMYKKYGEIDENDIPTAEQDDICRHCPLATASVVPADRCNTLQYHCAKNILYRNIEDDLINYLNSEKSRKKYTLTGNFATDGDFAIRLDEMDEEFRDCIEFDGCEDYSIYFETDEICDMYRFLNQLSVSFRVYFTHNYILPDLYDLVNDITVGLHDKNKKTIQRCLTGNYDGTELYLLKKGE